MDVKICTRRDARYFPNWVSDAITRLPSVIKEMLITKLKPLGRDFRISKKKMPFDKLMEPVS